MLKNNSDQDKILTLKLSEMMQTFCGMCCIYMCLHICCFELLSVAFRCDTWTKVFSVSEISSVILLDFFHPCAYLSHMKFVSCGREVDLGKHCLAFFML